MRRGLVVLHHVGGLGLACHGALDRLLGGLVVPFLDALVNVGLVVDEHAHADYSASKAAAISYLESLRVELRHSGIKVSTLCPGYIKSPMTAVNPYPMPFILETNEAARRMARAIACQTTFTVIPWQMGLVGGLLKILPRWLYDRLFAHAPHKPRNLPQ